MKFRSSVVAAAALALSAACYGQQNTLKVGDAAPGLDVEKWVRGSETTIESGKVYVVEFWATWCGPCKKSIPHLTELQRKYSDDGLSIIGVSSETEIEKVSNFVRTQGQKMDYTVAVDRNNGTQRAWMAAAKKEGIPCAFIVDQKSRIAWIGNPHPQANDGFDETLAKVMSGRFDAVLEKEMTPLLKQARQARKLRNWRLATQHFNEVLAKDARVFADIGLENFEMQLVDMADRKKAYEYARTDLLEKHFASDAGALQMLAEKIVADPKIEAPSRDMDFALEVVETARRVAGDDDAAALAKLALVRYYRGEVDQAIDLQKQAYFNAPPRHKPAYKRTLTTYQDASARVSKVPDKTN